MIYPNSSECAAVSQEPNYLSLLEGTQNFYRSRQVVNIKMMAKTYA